MLLLAVEAMNGSLHFILTVLFLGANLVFTQMISGGRFSNRLRYVGHEMVFFSMGIVSSRLLYGEDDKSLVFVSLFVYLLVWVFSLFLTRKVIEAESGQHYSFESNIRPQTGINLLVGAAAIYCSFSGIIQDVIERFVNMSQGG